jgi:hypothetical protein
LNPGPRPYQGRALPTEPRQQAFCVYFAMRFLPRDRGDLVFVSSVHSSRRDPLSSGQPLPGGRAGDGNRTHVACLEGRYSTIELHPPGTLWSGSGRGGSGEAAPRVSCRSPNRPSWGRTPGCRSSFAPADPSRRGTMGGAGFEPAKVEPPDLQSGPFSHLGIHPNPFRSRQASGRLSDPIPATSLATRGRELAVRVELTTVGLQNRCSAD